LRDKVYQEGLAPYLADNNQSWQLQSNGNYKRNKPGNARPRNTQGLLLEKLSKPCQ
jgi:polyphosphate kinase